MPTIRIASAILASALLAAAPIEQPVASVRPVTDTYYGMSVVDPYRWMESGGPEFDAYLHAQNAYARSQLDPLPQRGVLIDAMKASVAASGPIAKLEFVESVGSRTFLTRLPATGGYHALYVREGGRERLLFDPNLAAVPGEILLMAPSPDGKRVAFGVASGGSEKSIVHVVDVDTGRDHSENDVPFVADGLNWRDDSSFYYVRYDVAGDTRSTRTLLHRVGTSLDGDDTVLAAERLQNALRLEHQEVTITAVPPRYAVAEVQDGTDSEHEEVFVAPLAAANSGTAPWRKIAGTQDDIGSVAAREPDLFAAVVSEVGISDSLRFEQTPNGKGNIPEFGTVANEPGFRSLFAMSPYAHVTDGTAYPAFMMTTGLNDPRVAPWQVAKMEARVQAASTSGRPVLFRVDDHAGHGIGNSLDAQYAEIADIFGFVLWQEDAQPLPTSGS